MYIIGRDQDEGLIALITFVRVDRARLSTGWYGLRLEEASADYLTELWEGAHPPNSTEHLYRLSPQPDTGDHGYVLAGSTTFRMYSKEDVDFNELPSRENLLDRIETDELFS